MFDPLATIGGLFSMLFGIVGTTIEAFLLPTVQLILNPLLSWVGLFVQ